MKGIPCLRQGNLKAPHFNVICKGKVMVVSDEGCCSVIYTALCFIVEEEFLVGGGSFATGGMTMEIMAKTKAVTSK